MLRPALATAMWAELARPLGVESDVSEVRRIDLAEGATMSSESVDSGASCCKADADTVCARSERGSLRDSWASLH